MAQQIKHLGTVESINGARVRVRILQAAACSGCAAKSLCHAAESKEKTIEVYAADADTFHPGEQVELQGTLSQGLRAVLWAYAVPLVVMLLCLFAVIAATGDEAVGALCAVFSLAPYYLIIYALRKRFARNFTFSLTHLN